MQRDAVKLLSLAVAVSIAVLAGGPAFAQTEILRDGTVGTPDLAIQPALDAAGIIEIGEALGNRPGNGENVFHSFSVFDLANGNTALFTADPAKTTRNVISRVTGGQASMIDGTIASSIDGADLYLLNPRGLIFGPNARLDVPASFYASTAQSVSLLESDPDGALTFTDEPKLAFASPLAFGFLGEPAAIEVSHGILQITDGHTLSLTGGSVTLDAGQPAASAADREACTAGCLRAAGGRIQLAGVAEPGQVPVDISDWEPTAGGGLVRIADGAFIDAVGSSRGRITMRASSFDIAASSLQANGPISLVAAQRIGLANGANVTTQTTNDKTAGDIALVAGTEIVADGAAVNSFTVGTGKAGSIELSAEIVELENGTRIQSTSGDPTVGGGIGTAGGGSGSGGNGDGSGGDGDGSGGDGGGSGGGGGGDGSGDGGSGSGGGGGGSSDGGSGSGGDGGGSGGGGDGSGGDGGGSGGGGDGSGGDGGGSGGGGDGSGGDSGGDGGSGSGGGGSGSGGGGDGSGSGGSGSGGSGAVDPDEFGNGGDVRIVATERLTTRQNVNIGANSNAGGAAGDVYLEAPTIELLDGSRIASAAAATGDGGNIVINAASEVVLAGTNNPDDPRRDRGTRITASSAFTATGDAGSITINTGRLTLDDGARIASGTSGIGQGGSIRIVATEAVELSGTRGDGSGTSIRATTDIEEEEADVLTAARTGDAGAIFVSTPALTLNPGTEIASSTALPGRGGEIVLDVGELTMTGATIRATSVGEGSGDAGNVRIGLSTDSVAGVAFATIGSVAGNADATLAATGDDVASYPLRNITLTGSTIETSAVDAGGGDIVIDGSGALLVQQQSGIDASDTGGEGGNVFVTMRDSIVVIDDSRLLARAAVPGGAGGVIELTTDVFIKSNDSDVIAENRVLINRLEKNIEAEVAALPAEFIDAQDMFRASCAAASGTDAQSTFSVYRRSGLPLSPEYALIAFTVPAADEYTAPAVAAFISGRYQDAAEAWSAIATRAVTPAGRSDALRGVGQALQAQGKFAESLQPLTDSLAVARDTDDSERIAAALSDLGNAFATLDQRETAADYFSESLAMPGSGAATLINYGNFVATGGNPRDAAELYRRASSLAADDEERLLAVVNEARVMAITGQSGPAFELSAVAATLLSRQAPSHVKLLALINLAITDFTVATHDRARYETSLLKAHAGLLRARDLARDLDDPRSLSLALGYLGNLYFAENRLAEALLLTEEALDVAEISGSDDIVYRWHRQQGRVFWATGDADGAVAAYGRAVASLDETRQEALPLYGTTPERFGDNVAPLYMEFVDALITSSGRLSDTARRSELLADARSVVESLKEAELRDYFRDECVTELEAAAVSLDQIAADTAIVYPILLDDRLELLVSIGGIIDSYTVAVDKAELTELATSLRQKLENRTTYEFMPDAQRLYRYLVEPYAAQLERDQLTTLIFVPDGILRTVPMAALHDGERFLIENYAVGITPGLSLIAPKPITDNETRLLLAGVSGSSGDFSALPFVPNELRGIQDLLGGKLMLDEQFSSDEFGRYLVEAQPSVVHIASHAVFTGRAESSFLLTYDGQLTMDNLHEIVAQSKFREPLELLTLSACETAAGDERAALGLSGAAIRAGARSALGTLWTVSDEASQDVILDFYRELKQSDGSKAMALQSAQRGMIGDERFRHPYYWSAFVMISNWL